MMGPVLTLWLALTKSRVAKRPHFRCRRFSPRIASIERTASVRIATGMFSRLSTWQKVTIRCARRLMASPLRAAPGGPEIRRATIVGV
jgi:hypothetical protein